MQHVWTALAAIVLLVLLSLTVRVVRQYGQDVLVWLGRVIGVRRPGFTVRGASPPPPGKVKDIELPESPKRAMSRQAEAEREKRAKIIVAEGEAMAADALETAADVMTAHPLVLRLRNLQCLVEIEDHHGGFPVPLMNTIGVPLMNTIGEPGAFLAREASAAAVPRSDPSPAAGPPQMIKECCNKH